MTQDASVGKHFDADKIRQDLETDGITACKRAFSPAWVEQIREDVDAPFAEARARDGGAVGRGPNRWYVEIHPEALRGFVDLSKKTKKNKKKHKTKKTNNKQKK